MNLISLSIVASFVSLAQASDQVGTLTQLSGDVKIFTNPSPSVEGAKPRALYEGEYFTVKPAKEGDQIEKGNIVRTAPGAKARVIFENGDQYNVGSGSSYRVFWKKDSAKTDAQINLMYGKLRGIVAKGGPRSKLSIRTKTAVMGVRGTDFFIADDGGEGTEVSVLRGKVSVSSAKPTDAPEAKSGAEKLSPKKEIELSVGQSVEIVKKSETTEVRPTTKEELVAISKNSVFQERKDQAPPAILKLEEKAVKSVLVEIKREDPKLYAKMQIDQTTTTDALNLQVAQNLERSAPKAPEKHKPFRSELDDLESDTYRKYFKE